MDDVATPSVSRETGTPMLASYGGPGTGVWPGVWPAFRPPGHRPAVAHFPAAQREALCIVHHDKECRHSDPKFASSTVPSDVWAAGIDAASMARRCQTPL